MWQYDFIIYIQNLCRNQQILISYLSINLNERLKKKKKIGLEFLLKTKQFITIDKMNFTNTWTNCHEGLRNKTPHPEDFQDYATIFLMEKPLLGEPTPYSQFVNKTAHETVTDRFHISQPSDYTYFCSYV